jgi:hypothetical protein
LGAWLVRGTIATVRCLGVVPAPGIVVVMVMMAAVNVGLSITELIRLAI